VPAPAGSEQTFIADLAHDTGLSPQVIQAWVDVEGAYAPGGTGGYNFLNIRENTSRSGVPLAGTTQKGFAKFHSAGQAAQETAWWINNMSNYRGIKSSAGLAPESQLAAIAASPWDSSHYNGGRKLFAAYNAVVTGVGGSVTSVFKKIGSTVGDVVSGNPVGAVTGLLPSTSNIPVVGGVISAAEAPAKIAEDAGQVLAFVFNPQDWLRVGYILAGGILTLGGLFVLSRSVGAPQAIAAAAFPEGTLAKSAAGAAGVSAAKSSPPKRRQAAPQVRTRTVYVVNEEENRRERLRQRAATSPGPSNDIPF
jgi:hypothetical protein